MAFLMACLVVSYEDSRIIDWNSLAYLAESVSIPSLAVCLGTSVFTERGLALSQFSYKGVLTYSLGSQSLVGAFGVV